MKKNDNGSGFVYSTNPGFFSPGEQDLRIHLDRKGGGKMISRISGFKGSAEKIEELCKLLKQKCAVGGACKEAEIILQGDHREKLMKLLEGMGYGVKKSGG